MCVFTHYCFLIYSRGKGVICKTICTLKDPGSKANARCKILSPEKAGWVPRSHLTRASVLQTAPTRTHLWPESSPTKRLATCHALISKDGSRTNRYEFCCFIWVGFIAIGREPQKATDKVLSETYINVLYKTHIMIFPIPAAWLILSRQWPLKNKRNSMLKHISRTSLP